MTTSTEQAGVVPEEIKSEVVPEEIKEKLRWEVVDLTERLGERWIGGPWQPMDDRYRDERWHTQSQLDEVGRHRIENLAEKLAQWSQDLGRERAHLLLYLWQECWDLWDGYLIYRTLQVVEKAVEEVTKTADGESPDDWEPAAWRATGKAMSLITADARIFQRICLSDAEGLALETIRGVAITKSVISEIRSALDHLSRQPKGSAESRSDGKIGEGLRYIERVALESQFFYDFLGAAANALINFEAWLANAPHLDTGQHSPVDGEPSPAARRKVLEGIDKAIGRFGAAREKLTSVTLSRVEPWGRLLTEIREIVVPRENSENVSQVFVPRSASIRYCYPFAVGTDESSLDDCLRSHGVIKDDLSGKLMSIGVEVGDVRPLDPTAFFAARGSDSGLYGGVRVDLPDIELRQAHGLGMAHEQAERCSVWVILSRMGNHCLCVQPKPLETPLPDVLYRAAAVGTPFVVGVTAAIAESATGVAWDNLHSFSRDVIRAVANAGFWRAGADGVGAADQFVRGNLHEVLVTRTDGPLGMQPADIAAKLDSALGGRILLKSIQRAPTTIDEWVRYPPVRQRGSQHGVSEIVDLPELGLAGDWCVHTGETTVFGIVAAPSWHSDVYAEAAQFASSWSPLLRLWNSRLQKAIQHLGSDDRGRDNAREKSEELRRLEQMVRQHLSQIRSEELCATLAHRRFLDRLLDMSGVGRLQGELEAQLMATERLIDWHNENFRRESENARRESEAQQREAEQRREKLLGVIALFGMFELGTFLALANGTNWRQSFFGLFTLRQGVWEDWLMVSLFFVALLVGIYFDFFGVNGWLRRPFDGLRARRRRRRST